MPSSPQHPGSSSASLSPLTLGILKGLAFVIPGVLMISRPPAVLRFWDEMRELPVIGDITRDFQTTAALAGELFPLREMRFYSRPPTVMSEPAPVPNTLAGKARQWGERLAASEAARRYAWRRAEIEPKLAGKFSAGKMKRAAAFLDYIERYRDMAAMEMALSHVPASITLAQGLLESNAGQSYLAREANNHFGVKCRKRRNYRADGRIDDDDFYHHELAYDCVQRADDNAWDRFEMYETPELSYRRHTLLLARGDRYSWMIDRYHAGQSYRLPRKWFGRQDVPYYAAWAAGIKESGYATGSRYAQKVALIIDTYELWRVDYEVVLAE